MQEAELEKAKGLLSRFKNDHMTKLLDLLDIPRSELKDKVGCLPFCPNRMHHFCTLHHSSLSSSDAMLAQKAARQTNRTLTAERDIIQQS